MFPKFHFIKGFFKNLFNPRISSLAFVSVNNEIHSKVTIYRFAKVKGSRIGAYSYIGNDTDVENAEIGKFCSISDHCRIGMASHTLSYLSTSPIFTLANNACKEKWTEDIHAEKDDRTVIGNDVWIGSHALILGGIHVGDGAVIGAGAVVTKDVAPYAVVGGVPAKVIKYRFDEEIINRLEELKWWDKPDSYLKEHIEMFQKSNFNLNDI